MLSAVSRKTNYLIIGYLLDDNRQVTEGNKYKKSIELGTVKIMKEKEFELFCRKRLGNPNFILGRKKVKDSTANAEDIWIGVDEN